MELTTAYAAVNLGNPSLLARIGTTPQHQLKEHIKTPETTAQGAQRNDSGQKTKSGSNMAYGL